MKRWKSILVVVTCTLTLGLLGCPEKTEPPAEPPPAEEPAPPPAEPAEPAEAIPPEMVEAAKAEVTEANAEAIADELEKEIDGEMAE